MAKVLGGNSRSLDPKDFDGDVLVATIRESAHIQTVNGGRRVVRLVEFPDQPYWCNTTQTTAIVRVLGNDDDEWKGKRIALEKVTVKNPQTGEDVVKFYPMSPKAWAEAVAEFDAAQSSTSVPSSAPGGKGTPAKRSRGK